MGSAYKLTSIHSDHKYNNDNAKLELGSTPYSFADPGSRPFMLQGFACDPYSFNDMPYSQEHHILPIENRDNHILNCDSHNTNGKSLYEFRYKHSGESSKAKQLECVEDKDEKDSYIFELEIPGNTETTAIKNPEEYTFYCSAPFSEVCTKPNQCSSSTCPTYKEGSSGHPAEFTCKDKKWIVDGEYVVLEQNAVCDKDTRSGANKVAFFVTLPSGEVKKAEGAGCFTDFDCEKKSPLDLTTAALSHKDGIVTCTDPSINMNIYSYETNQALNATSFACEKSTGFWKNTTGATSELIASGSQITCPVLNITKKIVEANFSQGQIYGAIAGVFVAVLIVIALVAVFIFCWCLKRTCHVLDKKDWQKLGRVGRLKHCQEVFGKVIKTSPTSVHHIVHGLQQLDMLLDTETEDPEIWELVYPFLMRFHGTILRTDRQIWHMFSRYLYLQAKSIIDKHGWLSAEPIRSNSDKGLMRAVAIRLLAFAIEDRVAVNTEAKRMIVDGFRKLRRKGVQQYPHCGVMWSVISYAARTGILTNGQVGKRIALNHVKFMRYLKAIARQNKHVEAESSIPADQVIPVFGTLAEQAAFALGGTYSMNMQEKYVRRVLVKKSATGGAVSRYCFKGMCNSLELNPTPLIMFTCGASTKANPKDLKQTVPESDLNNIIEGASNLLVYNFRQFEAVKLNDYFMPGKHGGINLYELQLEQKEFEEVMQQQLEELREWYAAHSDKDDLKTKPVYITSIGSNMKLERRVDEGQLKGPEGLITGINGSFSDSSSSNAPTPAAAAGPPAAPAAESPAAP